MQPKGDFYALLTAEYVAIANRGRHFTREGLRAVCQAHLSPKGERSTTRIKDEGDAVGLLSEIREQRLAAYKNCPSDLEEDGRAEDVLRSEYAGRILPELIQNAHDAIASRPIGSKGVGFKAVLNVCKGPRIHSGPLHCGFDGEHSLKEFERADLVDGNESVPLMRLPFPVSEAEEPQPVRELIAKYDTVVVLPFIDEKARTRFLNEWGDYTVDATLLLFLPAVNGLVWERRDGDEPSIRVWRRECRDAIVEVYAGDDLSPVGKWRLWSSERASVALRLDREGALVVEPSCPNIRVFFETDERSPLPVLIHADFPLKEGRTNVLIDDDTGRTDIAGVIGEVASLVRNALAGVDDAGRLLDFLRPRVKPDEMGKLEGKLWATIAEQATNLEIPGAAALRLDQVRLRPEDENHQISWWWFGCDLWNAFKEVLSEHRVGGLAGLPFLPPGVDTKEREETLRHYRPDARLTVEQLRKLLLLPVEGSSGPVAPDESILFFPPKETPPLAPVSVEIRFLDRRFISAIERHDKQNALKEFLTEVCGVSEFTPRSLIAKAILPILRVGDQPNGLIGFLCKVIAPALRDGDLIFDWRDPVRRELAESLLIAIRNEELLPAVYVYAGADWTGNDFLEQVYSNRKDRGFLHPPPADEKERERWQRFYWYVGVGWCPKVLPIVCYEAKEKTREGPRWDDGIFSVAKPPECWPEYCGRLNDFDMGSRKARLRQNWTLDGGSEIIIRDGAFAVVSDNWDYYSKYRQAVIYRSSNLREDYDNERRTGPSHLFWLFQTCRWVPVRATSEKQGPSDVFARPEIARELGGWGYEVAGSADEEFLKSIGVRSGWRELDDADWGRWLKRSTEHGEDKLVQRPELREAVYNLYQAALRHWISRQEHPSRPAGKWHGPVWCIERRDDNTETWRLTGGRDDIYFVDRPELDDLRLPGIWIFPVRLNRLEEAARTRFSLKLLSDHLEGQPYKAVSDGPAADAIRQRLDERLPIVNAYLQVAGRENSNLLEKSCLPDVMVIDDLRVQFRLGDQIVGNSAKLDAYHSRRDKGWMLWLDAALFDGAAKPATTVWECVASALVYAGDLPLDSQPCLKDLLLYEAADLRRKLLSLGVTKETVDRVVQEPSLPVPVVEPVVTPVSEGPPVSEPPRPDGDTEPGSFPPQPAAGGGGHSGGSGGNTGGPRPSRDSEPGREAQEWIREELRRRLECDGWRISHAPTHDEELRETDIELHHDRFGSFHVEVKHSETDAIYWSENEVKKAKDNSSRYFMVILTRNKKEHFEEYWISDPLNDLKDLPRTGVWEWRGRQDGVVLQGGSARWHIPAPKPARPASFSFKVEIRRDWLTQHALDFAALKNCLGTLADCDQGED